MQEPEAARVIAIERCDLVVAERAWAFASEKQREIDAHWQRRRAESPAFFNGRIHMLARYAVSRGVLSGALFPVDFKSFLYWRDEGAPDRSVFDAFGSALIRTRDGAILLGRQRPGNVNEGLVYLPGGFIDARDVTDEGSVDIRASVLREVAEETGLRAEIFRARPGYRAAFIGQQVSIAVELCADADSDALVGRIRGHLAADPKSELEDVVAVRTLRDLQRHPVPAYAHALVGSVLGNEA